MSPTFRFIQALVGTSTTLTLDSPREHRPLAWQALHADPQIIIAKHRNGQTCDIDMLFKGDQIRFIEMSEALDVRAQEMGTVTFDSAMNNEFE